MWKRLNESRLKNLGNGSPEDGFVDFDIMRRAYGPDGKIWPRIVISVTKGFGCLRDESPEYIRISYSIKRNNKAWWSSDVDLPVELLPEMADILNEAYEKLRDIKKRGGSSAGGATD